MVPMPVVAVQPERQCGGTVVRGWVGLSVGPFAQGGLDEALSLAVCLGRIGLSSDVLEAEIAAGAAEGLSTTVEFARRLRVDGVASDSAWPRLDGCAATATSRRDDRALCRPHVAGR